MEFGLFRSLLLQFRLLKSEFFVENMIMNVLDFNDVNKVRYFLCCSVVFTCYYLLVLTVTGILMIPQTAGKGKAIIVKILLIPHCCVNHLYHNRNFLT